MGLRWGHDRERQIIVDTGGDGNDRRRPHGLQSRTAFTPLVSAPSAPEADGAWWPRSRSLTVELRGFVDAWPAERGRIQRILHSSLDWDDHPHSVPVAGRRIKTGTFPRDDTHVLTVCMANRTDHIVSVIDPGTPTGAARRALLAFTAGETDDDLSRWSDEGGSGRASWSDGTRRNDPRPACG